LCGEANCRGYLGAPKKPEKKIAKVFYLSCTCLPLQIKETDELKRRRSTEGEVVAAALAIEQQEYQLALQQRDRKARILLLQ